MSALQGAVESGAPVSRLHERQSFDPADFGVPSGREEEWRFTPLRRLRGLHTDETLCRPGRSRCRSMPRRGVTVERPEHGDPRLGAALCPGDRVSARAFRFVRRGHDFSTCADSRNAESYVGHGPRGGLWRALRSGTSWLMWRRMRGRLWCWSTAGSATYADNVELVVGDGAALTVVSLQELGGGCGASVASSRAAG